MLQQRYDIDRLAFVLTACHSHASMAACMSQFLHDDLRGDLAITEGHPPCYAKAFQSIVHRSCHSQCRCAQRSISGIQTLQRS